MVESGFSGEGQPREVISGSRCVQRNVVEETWYSGNDVSLAGRGETPPPPDTYGFIDMLSPFLLAVLA